MRLNSPSLLSVTLFASLFLGSAQALATANEVKTLADLQGDSVLVFTRDLELDSLEGTILIGFKSNTSFWATGSNAGCFFFAEVGPTSIVESGSAWRFVRAPRLGWREYLATLKSVTDGRVLKMLCRKDPGESIPLSGFLEAFNKAGLQVTPAIGNSAR